MFRGNVISISVAIVISPSSSLVQVIPLCMKLGQKVLIFCHLPSQAELVTVTFFLPNRATKVLR